MLPSHKTMSIGKKCVCVGGGGGGKGGGGGAFQFLLM